MSRTAREAVDRHGLTEEEYGRILEILGREPTPTELGIFSAMWSEHCSYKSSRVHLKRLPTAGSRVVQGPGENAGAVEIGDGWVVVFKMESHNHPSFIEPYQGAATGVGGILRDIFTMGARPVASLNALRFGPLDVPRNRYLLKGVVAGIAGYGNCVGVPTVGGEIQIHPSFSLNPLVNVMTVGIARKERIFRGRAAGVGNPVLYVGARTGRDGIHGAAMASAEFDEAAEAKRPTVQVGDPFTEKLLLEACLEIMKQDWVVGIQDMGAAGLTSASAEMASRAGTGVEIDVSRVPRREEGMTPYEIMLSESQERMLLVAREGREAHVEAVFRKWGLEVAVVGRVTDDGLLRVRDGDAVVAEIPASALADGAPRYQRPMAPPADLAERQRLDLSQVPVPRDLGAALLRLLAHPTIASKRWVYEQYDHMVRTNTAVGPGSDAAVLRLKGTRMGLAVTVDCNSRHCFLDPRAGAAGAVAEAARNVVCSGAEPLAVTDCLNFGNPERPEVMWQFSQAVDGIAAACNALGTPVVSGNVSFYNETSGKGIHPTPAIGMVGLLRDVNHRTTMAFKGAGHAVVLLGETREDLGGSEYLALEHGLEQGKPPHPDLDLERRVQRVCLQAIREGLVQAAHDLSTGGLAVALAEACVASPDPVGVRVEVPNPRGLRMDALLFGETHSRILLEVAPRDLEAVAALARAHGVPCVRLGTVEGDRMRIRVEGRDAVDLSVAELLDAWTHGLPRALGEVVK